MFFSCHKLFLFGKLHIIKSPHYRFSVATFVVAVRAQEEGYEYNVPENPLVIERPDDPVADQSSKADSQAAAPSHGGGGGGHHHHSSDDPLEWLRESVPGTTYIYI